MNMLKIFIWGIIILLFGLCTGLAPVAQLGLFIVIFAPIIIFCGFIGSFFKWLIDIKSP
ncbi:MAG: hypothetical protein HZB33_12620 [Nitrospirae bacterium]|nr:hypothetical protein [Nitrospirota bacterium]